MKWHTVEEMLFDLWFDLGLDVLYIFIFNYNMESMILNISYKFSVIFLL